ncbi:Pvc16 family protein [Crossiella cryophila]|uniref:Pvc16 N-terminal domain-containing protein n=1 Tax=Crossiella cryophila TaxID=43355 RepID=A0A7W7FV41_9PSEU|nr:Pvc16 family protein [Crossiella cryophila]MBB4680016.1 hypothetical protein [Crossiella cryophila]
MITDVDQAVRAVLTEALGGTALVEFALPTDPPEDPVLALLLRDIRAEAGGSDWTDIRDETGRVVGRRPPVRRFRLTYLLCAQAREPEQEHRLLEIALRTLTAHPTLAIPALPAQPATLDVGVPVDGPLPGIGLAVTGPLVPDVLTALESPVESLDLGTGGPATRAVHPGPTRWRQVRFR